MKRIVLSLFILATVFAGCEKVENKVEGLNVDSVKKSESSEKIVETNEITQVPIAPNIDSVYMYPFFNSKVDSTFNLFTPFQYWHNIPVLQPDSSKLGNNDGE
ncbi:hypothetical protein [Carboxylicivirga sp. M1479]|uniref:hypothetical protein n=1 Tax=Carboxylicivirga sp. M1479 TaxID=2594476 RepID=UPI0011779341|nr:hypothetical protein [Carboxylicivirga sp. M1479]TRX70361.1 hypothetical protein FNN09_11585 [Carboxylicivirga sp. M1479]